MQAALDAMTEYYERTTAQQQHLETQMQDAHQQLQQLQTEHAACQAVRYVAELAMH